jgi:hypothetical protein
MLQAIRPALQAALPAMGRAATFTMSVATQTGSIIVLSTATYMVGRYTHGLIERGCEAIVDRAYLRIDAHQASKKSTLQQAVQAEIDRRVKAGEIIIPTVVQPEAVVA